MGISLAQKIEMSRYDLIEDFKQLRFLQLDAESIFTSHIRNATNVSLYSPLHRYIFMRLDQIRKVVATTLKEIHKENLTTSSHDRYVVTKKECGIELREIRHIIAAEITRIEWQSPSFKASQEHQAGHNHQLVVPYVTDYKRDRHSDEIAYTNSFIKEYIENPNAIPIRTYLTNSGMSSISTVLGYLFMENVVIRGIMMGKSCYHENKQLVSGIFGNKVIWFDEKDDEKTIKTIQQSKPDVIFIDSICNSAELYTPNVSRLLHFLVYEYLKPIHMVIDNTCLSVFGQYFKNVTPQSSHIGLIQVESLAKYHQYGQDRVTGGIILAYGLGSEKLSDYREHMGTNISDVSVYNIPKPDKTLQKLRLHRLERNASLMASALSEHLNEHLHGLDSVVYPKLIAHPTKGISDLNGYYGSNLTFAFQKQCQSVTDFNRFQETLFAHARQENISIIGGTSFGFDTTRIYRVANHSAFTKPFVRLSLGTETYLEMTRLIGIIHTSLHEIIHESSHRLA